MQLPVICCQLSYDQRTYSFHILHSLFFIHYFQVLGVPPARLRKAVLLSGQPLQVLANGSLLLRSPLCGRGAGGEGSGLSTHVPHARSRNCHPEPVEGPSKGRRRANFSTNLKLAARKLATRQLEPIPSRS